MSTPIIEIASRYLFAAPPPGSRVPIATHGHLDRKQIADKTAVHSPFHGKEVPIPSAVVVDGKHFSCFFCSVNHGRSLGSGKTHRLFNDGMLPCLRSLNA